MTQLDRRSFLRGSMAAGAAFTIAGTKSSGKVRGANDSIRVAVAGLNGRGKSHVAEFSGVPGVEITYLVDPDVRTFGPRLKQIQGLGGSPPRTVQDVRTVLDDPNVDAISIATPNHWHSLMAIWGCQAGKDVYVEKPCSHNVREGRVLVDAARKYGRIVQHGTQSRTSPQRSNEIEAVHSGKYGKLLVSKGYCYKPRWSIGFKETKQPPSEVDFNLWLGPAAVRPFHENLVHYNWHWFWDFGNGDIGNQGVHEMDRARWAIEGATLPTRIVSFGGRFGYEDQGETPNTLVTAFDYGDAQLVFEVRGMVYDGKKRNVKTRKVGNEFYTTEGLIFDGKFYPKQGGKAEKLQQLPSTRGPGESHFANFIAAVRSRSVSDLNAEILQGHLSAALCHLANISYRVGNDAPLRAAGMVRPQLERLLGGMENHLWEQGVALEETTFRKGRTLTFDAGAERFVGDAEADALLSRHYRAPFAVPEVA